MNNEVNRGGGSEDGPGRSWTVVPGRTPGEKIRRLLRNPAGVVGWRLRGLRKRGSRRLRRLQKGSLRSLRRLRKRSLRSLRLLRRWGVSILRRRGLRSLRWMLRAQRRWTRRLVSRWPTRWGQPKGVAWARYQAGYMHFLERNYARSVHHFTRAVELKPAFAGAWIGLARAHRSLGHFDAAWRAINEALQLTPQSDSALWAAADIAAKRKDLGGLREILGYPTSLSGLPVLSLVRRSRIALEAGDADLASAAAAAALKQDPQDEEALVVLGKVGLARGDKDPALDVVRLAASAQDRSLLRAAARLHVELGDLQGAVEKLDRLGGADPDLLVVMAQRLYDQGLLSGAQRLLARLDSSQDERVGFWRSRIDQELLVLRGDWEPPAAAERSRVQATPGRVLHIVGRALPEAQVGYTIRTLAMVQNQQRAGLDPHVVTSLGFPPGALPSPDRSVELIEGVPHHRLLDGQAVPGGLQEKLNRSYRLLYPLVRQLQPAVLQPASDYLNALLALALRRSTGIPVVYEVRGFWEESWLSRRQEAISGTSDQYGLRRSIETRCMTEADHVVTIAEVMRSDIVERGIPAEKVTVIPNAVDPDVFTPQDRDPQLARRLNLSSDHLVVGYISSLLSYEGIDYLIRAVAALAPAFPNVRLLLAGDGPERIALETLADELLAPGTAIFTGRVPHRDITSYYGLIDVFVVPRTSDKVCRLVTPLKPYEAMATGRPVIVSSVPALREMVRVGVTGLTFEPESVPSLARTLRQLLEDASRRAEMGRCAREWVCAERTWSRNAGRYLEVYRNLGVV